MTTAPYANMDQLPRGTRVRIMKVPDGAVITDPDGTILMGDSHGFYYVLMDKAAQQKNWAFVLEQVDELRVPASSLQVLYRPRS